MYFQVLHISPCGIIKYNMFLSNHTLIIVELGAYIYISWWQPLYITPTFQFCLLLHTLFICCLEPIWCFYVSMLPS
jgi:hypothetical protein